jgi:hypothetical protein
MLTIPPAPVEPASAELAIPVRFVAPSPATSRRSAWIVTCPPSPGPKVLLAIRPPSCSSSSPAVTATLPARPLEPGSAELAITLGNSATLPLEISRRSALTVTCPPSPDPKVLLAI